MKIKYVGSLNEGSVDVGGKTYNFTKDVPIELPDALAKALLHPDVWIEFKKGGR